MNERDNASCLKRSLSDLEEDQLLEVAMNSLKAAVGKGAPARRPAIPPMPRHCQFGVCVALYKKGMVRGCARIMDPACSLKAAVARIVEDAALNDARFRPVTRDELPCLEVEIALLTGFRMVKAPEEITPGCDGLFVMGDDKSALLPPQLTQICHGDPLRALEIACLKAGLSPDAHGDPGVTVYAFSAYMVGGPRRV